MSGKFFDVTIPIRSGMVHWPGDPEVKVTRIASIAEGDGVNISGLQFGLHTGTHMDAPLHFIDKAEDITAVPIDLLIGKARVIQTEHPEFIGKDEILRYNIKKGERILFRTRNSDSEWYKEDFKEDFVYLDEGAAAYLAETGVRLAGIDYLSIAKFREGERTHKILLGKGVWIIEGLYLRDVPEGEYEMYALPLNVSGADGAPVRVILRA